MDFRLVYEGELKAAGRASTRVVEKHSIRKKVHKQLKCLWNTNPMLLDRTKDHQILDPGITKWNEHREILSRRMASSDIHPSLLETLGNTFSRCNFKFVPLVNKRLNLSCGLDIIFLRRDMPGTPLIHSGGDIDNRIKVLLDALRIPSDCGELPANVTKDADEDPYFFCLLESDSLITQISVTTDNLLRPDMDENHVHLVIKAKVRPIEFSFENLAFAI